jgi:hypothetical protein
VVRAALSAGGATGAILLATIGSATAGGAVAVSATISMAATAAQPMAASMLTAERAADVSVIDLNMGSPSGACSACTSNVLRRYKFNICRDRAKYLWLEYSTAWRDFKQISVFTRKAAQCVELRS